MLYGPSKTQKVTDEQMRPKYDMTHYTDTTLALRRLKTAANRLFQQLIQSSEWATKFNTKSEGTH